MPNTPRTRFNFKNNNIESNVPSLGITHVIARTTTGPFNDPSQVLNSFAQFQRLFGEEIVPDGSISNIKKAFENGSRLRVSRVEGSNGVTGLTTSAGKLTIYDFADGFNPSKVAEVGFTLSDKYLNSKYSGYGIHFEITKKGVVLKVYNHNFVDDVFNDPIYTSEPLLLGMEQTVIDENENTINLVGGFAESNTREIILNWFNNLEYVKVNSQEAEIFVEKALEHGFSYVDDGTTYYRGLYDEGVDTWVPYSTGGDKVSIAAYTKAYNAIKAYSDGYQIFASHIHQYEFVTGEAYTTVLHNIADDLKDKYNKVLYVEVPKSFTTVNAIKTQLTSMQGAIGVGKHIAYFAGGIRYYDDMGIQRNCDVLGTIVGLGDTCATQYGPWISFAGMNRGVIENALGPVMDNLGGDDQVDALQELAELSCNVILTKDTRFGRRVMLWHLFTSTPMTDSEKFLTIVRLNMYLKKNLKPLVESYIEEPNDWTSWKRLYMEVKPILDDLVTRRAMATYRWDGDQDVTNYQDLQINTEAEVRQGKYKVELHYVDIVTLQDITINITIDAPSNTVTIE